MWQVARVPRPPGRPNNGEQVDPDDEGQAYQLQDDLQYTFSVHSILQNGICINQVSMDSGLVVKLQGHGTVGRRATGAQGGGNQ